MSAALCRLGIRGRKAQAKVEYSPHEQLGVWNLDGQETWSFGITGFYLVRTTQFVYEKPILTIHIHSLRQGKMYKYSAKQYTPEAFVQFAEKGYLTQSHPQPVPELPSAV